MLRLPKAIAPPHHRSEYLCAEPFCFAQGQRKNGAIPPFQSREVSITLTPAIEARHKPYLSAIHGRNAVFCVFGERATQSKSMGGM